MNKHIGSDFEDFLKEENIYEDVEAIAVKHVLALQIQKELKKKKLTKAAVAKKLNTSRAALDRILDPNNTSITLKTLVRLALVLGRKVKLSLSN